MSSDALESYTIEIDNIGEGLESHYFKILSLMRVQGYDVSKTKDVYASSEMSSFWGDMARRRGEQESRAMQLMGTLNGMVKDLFKLVRTVTITEERLSFYDRSKEGDSAADSALKDIWVTLVEQGTKNPASVLGLASQVGFAPLPDYFYTTRVQNADEVDTIVGKYDISEKLAYTLKRKLSQFVAWRERSEKELRVRLKVTKNMLRTHISQLRLYAEWLKPYLRAISKLRDIQEERPELVSSFETAWVELSLDGVKKDEKKFGKNIAVIKANFTQRTTPAEAFQQNYQKGFVHRGRVEIKLSAHVYTEDEWAKEKAKEDEELFDFLIKHINESLADIKDDLIHVMNDDYEKLYPKKKKEEHKTRKKFGEQILDSFLNVFPFFGYLKKPKNKNGPSFHRIFKMQQKFDAQKQRESAETTVASGYEDGDLWKVYDLFKQSRGFARP
ncbi:hypothetical protein COT72_01150 [archaeon CG10_big_fil_rev_8_21_14_0_10_43_11]|nr:MAG: hypothetical protein COT72_01150 [archaeon CG10_big_fil_rev_8_21_14_0_10_43_11]